MYPIRIITCVLFSLLWLECIAKKNISYAQTTVDNSYGAAENISARMENSLRLRQLIIKTQLETCPYTPLCNNIATPVQIPGSCCQECSCDVTTCDNDGNCCVDIINEEYFDVNEDISVSLKQCIAFTFGLKYTYYGRFGVSSCPLLVTDKNTSLCKLIYNRSVNLQDITPVYDNKSFIIYRNKYCAYCHGLSENEFSYFEPLLKCENFSGVSNNASDLLFTVVENDDCHIEFFANETQYDFEFGKCYPSIHECNVTGNWASYDAEIERACQIFRSPLKPVDYNMIPSFIYETNFRNIFCLLCNGLHETHIFTNCTQNIHSGIIQYNDFSMLVNVREEQPSIHVQNKVFCAERKALVNGICIFQFESYTDIFIRLPLRIFPTEQAEKSEIEAHLKEIMWAFSDLLNQHQTLRNICIEYKWWGIRTHVSNLEDINSSVTPIQNTSLDIVLKVGVKGEINSNITNVFITMLQNKHLNICTECVTLENRSGTDENSDVFIYKVKYDSGLLLQTPIYENGTSFEYGDKLPYTFDDCSRYDNELSVFDHFECPLIALSHNNISWEKSFDGILRIGEIIILDTEQYYFLDQETVANKVFCAERKALVNGICIFQFESYTDIFIRLPLRIFPTEQAEKSEIEAHLKEIMWAFSDLLNQHQTLRNICIEYKWWGIRTHVSNLEDINSSVTPIQNTSLDIVLKVGVKGEINSNITNVFITMLQNKHLNICTECVTLENRSGTDENSDVFIYKVKYDSGLLLQTPIYENGTSFEYGDKLPYTFDDCSRYDNELSVFDHFECPLIALSHNNISWEKSFDGILRIGEIIILDTEQYYFLDQETVAVCMDVYELYINSIMLLDVANPIYGNKSIISLVCIGLSLLGLAVSLIIYSVDGQLRKGIPGINVMLLMCSLLLAQTMYIISSFVNVRHQSAFCVALGIVVHVSWLLVMFEMNVCTYHMFYMLGFTRLTTGGTGLMRCCKYQLYVALSSSFWVCINITFSKILKNDIGYGNVHCYINEQTMVYITFALPVLFVIITNALMFVKVVINIRRSQSIQRHVENDRNEISIFVKLSTLTGLTWIFGLVYSITNLNLFAYIFIILNASQGVFLFFAFICNRRVLGVLKKRFIRSKTAVTSNNRFTSKSAIQSNKTNTSML